MFSGRIIVLGMVGRWLQFKVLYCVRALIMSPDSGDSVTVRVTRSHGDPQAGSFSIPPFLFHFRLERDVNNVLKNNFDLSPAIGNS